MTKNNNPNIWATGPVAERWNNNPGLAYKTKYAASGDEWNAKPTDQGNAPSKFRGIKFEPHQYNWEYSWLNADGFYLEAKKDLPIYALNDPKITPDLLTWNIRNKGFKPFDTLLKGARYPIAVHSVVTDGYGQKWFIFYPQGSSSSLRTLIPYSSDNDFVKHDYTPAQEIAIKKDNEPGVLDKISGTIKTVAIAAVVIAVIVGGVYAYNTFVKK